MIVLRVKMKQRITYGENKLHFGVLLENTLHLIPIVMFNLVFEITSWLKTN